MPDETEFDREEPAADLEPTAVVSISSAPQMLERANDLLELAGERLQCALTLAACATIVLCEALDQALRTTLAHRASCFSFESEEAENLCESLLYEPLRTRMLRAPEVVSSGGFRLRRRTPEVEALHELITTRNKLAHVDEPPVEIELTAEHIDNGRVKLTVPMPQMVWDSVKVTDAKRYQTAVVLYFEEFLNRADDLREGRLLVCGS